VAHGGFFPNGVQGLVMAMAVIMFSFGGLELIGITAAEADNPSRSIPRATNQALWRVLIFYIGALFILLSLFPWKRSSRRQPLRADLRGPEQQRGRHALNIVVLTAALSVYNSGVYANTRMLFGLAEQGNAPRALLKVTSAACRWRRWACRPSPPASASRELLPAGRGLRDADGAGDLGPDHQLGHDQLDPPALPKSQGRHAHRFPSPFYPIANYLCLAFLAGITVVMYLIPGMRISVYLIPVWLLALIRAWPI
jgi:aromatic amino acid transport protein AroP